MVVVEEEEDTTVVVEDGRITAAVVSAVEEDGVEIGEEEEAEVEEEAVGMTAVVAVVDGEVEVEIEMTAAGQEEEEEGTGEKTGIVMEVVEKTLEVETMGEEATNGVTKETGGGTGVVTKETGVEVRATGAGDKVATGEGSREAGIKVEIGAIKDSGTRAPIRDMGNGTMPKLLDNNR